MTTFLRWKRRYTSILRGALMVTVYLASLPSVQAAETVDATLYKNPSCRCCDQYAAYLRQYDYEIKVTETPNLRQFKAEHGVPSRLQSCHTMLLDGYVIEGHVPVGVINKLLDERPEIRGVSLPGMPQGSPGMSGQKREPFVIGLALGWNWLAASGLLVVALVGLGCLMMCVLGMHSGHDKGDEN